MLMHNPPHPGAIIKELCLDPSGCLLQMLQEL